MRNNTFVAQNSMPHIDFWGSVGAGPCACPVSGFDREADKTRSKEYTLANHLHLTGAMLAFFNQFRKRVLNADYLRFLRMAFGSLRELHYQLSLSKRLGFLCNEENELLEPKIVEAFFVQPSDFSLQSERLIDQRLRRIWIMGGSDRAIDLTEKYGMQGTKGDPMLAVEILNILEVE